MNPKRIYEHLLRRVILALVLRSSRHREAPPPPIAIRDTESYILHLDELEGRLSVKIERFVNFDDCVRVATVHHVSLISAVIRYDLARIQAEENTTEDL